MSRGRSGVDVGVRVGIGVGIGVGVGVAILEVEGGARAAARDARVEGEASEPAVAGRGGRGGVRGVELVPRARGDERRVPSPEHGGERLAPRPTDRRRPEDVVSRETTVVENDEEHVPGEGVQARALRCALVPGTNSTTMLARATRRHRPALARRAAKWRAPNIAVVVLGTAANPEADREGRRTSTSRGRICDPGTPRRFSVTKRPIYLRKKSTLWCITRSLSICSVTNISLLLQWRAVGVVRQTLSQHLAPRACSPRLV